MKKVILSLALVVAFSTTFVSCRETKKEEIEVNVDDVDDVEDDIEDAVDDVEDAVNEGVDEIKENTGTGGTDDN
jgi:DNA-binding transcriptional regulator GbsR (MarR family)